ncbi:UNVERIFIED_CONTAM: Thrombospondin type-1 domain-containing protein 4 [Gekko kuhli]
MCANIGCDDYLGSDKVVDKCGICGGDNTACKVVSGVFKHTLTNLGYHKIVEIPEGATKINITEMSKSNNYLGELQMSTMIPLALYEKATLVGSAGFGFAGGAELGILQRMEFWGV